jgi:hypothetical protein
MHIQQKLRLFAGAFVALLCLFAGPAQATLMGDNVDLTYYYPVLSSPSDYGDRTVPTATFNLFGYPGLQLTVSDTQINADLNLGDGYYWSPAQFNGWVLTDLTHSNITGVTIGGENNFGLTNSDISWTSNSVTVNWQGLHFGNGGQDSTVTLDVSTRPVPEPTSLALAGLGLLSLAVARRKAKQK